MRRKDKYAPPRVIAVDVDGTLFVRGALNKGLAEWCRKKKQEGFFLILWSSRGREYALKAAGIAGLEDTFDTIISKPGYIVDDKGWAWIKHTRIVRKLSA